MELLERRRLLALIQVTTLGDTVNFNDNVTSLREAVFAANLVPGADTIEFAASLTSGGPASIVLTQGELLVADDVTINGPGAGLLTIDGVGSDASPGVGNGLGIRLFNIDDNTAALRNVRITGLTLTGGDASGPGGAILARENLSIANCIITGNTTTSAGALGGGGIYSRSATGPANSLTVTNSTISNNLAPNSEGGGIRKRAGSLIVEGSTISGNRVATGGGGISSADSGVSVQITASTIRDNQTATANTSLGRGGGLLILEGSAAITSSTFSGNAARLGGAIWSNTNLTGTQQTTIVSSTISGNVATARAGGVYNYDGLMVIRYSTITANRTIPGAGGGLVSRGSTQVTRTDVRSSIIAGNVFSATPTNPAAPATPHDVLIVTALNVRSLGYNLLGAGNLTPFNQPGDRTGVTNPRLAPLADNGGPTRTHLPLASSAAVDAGDPSAAGLGNVPAFDQRGAPFARILDSAGSAGAAIDIGAVEAQIVTVSFVVDTLADEDDGDFSPGDQSLREAINRANLDAASVNVITFSPLLTANGPAVITLGSGALKITDFLQLNGPGANLLTVDASGSDPNPNAIEGNGASAFVVDDLNSNSTIEVQISGLTLTGADSIFGGAIENREGLTIADCDITGNAATEGGAIGHFGGQLDVVSTVISGNVAANGGGAIQASRPVSLIDSVISGNSARLGGGILSYGQMALTRTAVIGNTSLYGGGGIFCQTADLVDSQVTGNHAYRGGGIYASGMLTMSGSTIRDNSAVANGGGIYAPNGASLTASEIKFNSAGKSGGGIFGGGIFAGGALLLASTTISGNTALLHGGGMYAAINSLVRLDGVTLDSNTANADGGGLWAKSGDVQLLNSTVSGNVAGRNGGGAYLFTIGLGAPADIRHSTVVFNQAIQFGGGAFIAGPIKLDHSIFANAASFGPDITGIIGSTIDARYSIVAESSMSGLVESLPGQPDSKGNFIGGPNSGLIDVKLASLSDNGGPTRTHLLMPDSLAINAGDPAVVPGEGSAPDADQRGAPFNRVAGPRIDIGAYERQSLFGLNLVVDSLADESDGDYSAGDLTLREAVSLVNGSLQPNTVTFAPALTAAGPAVIRLSRGELAVTESLGLIGPGAPLLTIDASASDPTPSAKNGDGARVFNINNQNGIADRAVTLRGLTLTGGDAPGSGGAIYSLENLHLLDLTITGNASAPFTSGGGIDSIGGTLTVLQSRIIANSGFGGGAISFAAFLPATLLTISDSDLLNNAANIGGAAVQIIDGKANITRSKVSGNTGGGIVALGSNLTLIESTISDNTGAYYGGGVFSNSGLLTISRSAISGNSALRNGGGVAALNSVNITDSTISGNAAVGVGGGVFSGNFLPFPSSTSLAVTGSTISGNSAENGGGIFTVGANQLTLAHSTITGNSADTPNGAGGVASYYFLSPAQLSHVIVAGNTDVAHVPSDFRGFATLSFSLIGVGDGATFSGNTANSNVGTLIAPIDPRLAPLADNGGPTKTHALLPDSPALEAGNPLVTPGTGGVPVLDQRGLPRRGGLIIDLGAVEMQPQLADFENDFDVDGGDFLVWQRGFGLSGLVSKLEGDADADGDVDGGDLALWAATLGARSAVPAVKPAVAPSTTPALTAAQVDAALAYYQGLQIAPVRTLRARPRTR